MSEYKDPVLTEEQLAAFEAMTIPSEFDSSRIKNKRLSVRYGTLSQQLADVYLPDKGDGPFPLIIYVHGGGWSMGNRNFGALDFVARLVDFGYAVASVDYRLAPGAVFPEFLFDVKTAVRWARASAAEYGFDPARFGMIGDSAGGHLALMTAFTAGHPEYEGGQYGWEGHSSAIQAVVSMYGPSDLAADNRAFLAESGLPLPPQRDVSDNAPSSYDIAFTRDKNMLRLISPISYVHKNIPPVMLQQGAKDLVVPLQQSTLLAEKIRRICGPDRVTLRVHEKLGHSERGFCSAENFLTILRFFKERL